MLKAVSTYLYVKERLHPGILDGLVAQRSAGDRNFRGAAASRLRQPQAARERNCRLVPRAAGFR